MAKRFTDTEKWKKPFLKSLPAPYKLLWFYICDDCDHAGVWQVDLEVAEIRIGEKITEKMAVECFGDKIIIFDGGTKWFIPSFIEFQYPSGLNPANNAHAGIIKILEKYGLTEIENKPLISPSQGDKVTDKDKEKDMVKEKELNEIEIGKTIEYIRFTGQRTLTKENVTEYWQAFLIHSEGEFHRNRADKIQHFRNWLKKQPNETTKRTTADASAPGKQYGAY